MMRAHLAILLALALLAGCAAAGGPTATGGPVVGNRPEALSGYPESRYLTATGLGMSEAEARNQAVAELSRVFHAVVRSETADRVRLVARSGGDETVEQRLDAQVSVISNVELKGAEVVRTWREGSTHYALAVLERASARQAWLRDIRSHDREIQGRLEAVKDLWSPLLLYQSLRAVADLWVEREILVSRLQVLGYPAGPEPPYDMKDVVRRIVRTRAGMPVFIFVEGQHGARVRAALADALGRAGFVLAATRGEAAVSVEGSVRVEPVEIENPELFYARARVGLAVKDLKAGVSVGEVSLQRRGVDLAYPEAVHRALESVVEPAARQLVSLMEAQPEPPERGKE